METVNVVNLTPLYAIAAAVIGYVAWLIRNLISSLGKPLDRPNNLESDDPVTTTSALGALVGWGFFWLAFGSLVFKSCTALIAPG